MELGATGDVISHLCEPFAFTSPHSFLMSSVLAATANIQYASHDIKVTLLHNPSHLGIHRTILLPPFR